MRIVILGNAGSGKSTLAKSLARSQRMPMLDLDTVVWAADQIGVQRDERVVRADLAWFCRESDRWVIDGCYGDLVAAVLPDQPLLVLLDPGLDACVANCLARPWEPHKYRSKSEQDAQLTPLLDWVVGYYDRDGPMSRTAHRAVFDGYRGPKRLVTRLVELDALSALVLAAAATPPGRHPPAGGRRATDAPPSPPPRSLAR